MDKTERHNQSVALYNKLLELNAVTPCLTNDDLCQIILKTDGQTRAAAWYLLLNSVVTQRRHFCFIIRHVPALRHQAWSEFRHRTTPEDLYFIMKHVEPLRDEAWREYVLRFPTENDVPRRLIHKVATLRLAAAKKLLACEPTLRDLYLIKNEVRELRKEVEKKLEEPKYQLLQKLFDLYHG